MFSVGKLVVYLFTHSLLTQASFVKLDSVFDAQVDHGLLLLPGKERGMVGQNVYNDFVIDFHHKVFDASFNVPEIFVRPEEKVIQHRVG
jgi:hypothetical protein